MNSLKKVIKKSNNKLDLFNYIVKHFPDASCPNHTDTGDFLFESNLINPNFPINFSIMTGFVLTNWKVSISNNIKYKHANYSIYNKFNLNIFRPNCKHLHSYQHSLKLTWGGIDRKLLKKGFSQVFVNSILTEIAKRFVENSELDHTFVNQEHFPQYFLNKIKMLRTFS